MMFDEWKRRGDARTREARLLDALLEELEIYPALATDDVQAEEQLREAVRDRISEIEDEAQEGLECIAL